MTAHDPLTSLGQVRDHAWEAVRMCADRDRADLDTDRQFYLAIVKLLEIVGEAARRIPDSVRTQYPAIPWADIVGLRSWLVHAYDGIDCDVIWATVQDDLPKLIHELEQTTVS